MAEKYTQEQFWKLYEKLPQELRDAIFSEETSKNIWEICERNNIKEISKIGKYTGRVLLGILPPDEFQETLEKELKLKKDLAKKVAREINRFIFYPVKTSLEEIYKIPVVPPPAELKVAPAPKEKSVTPPEKDIYREPIE